MGFLLFIVYCLLAHVHSKNKRDIIINYFLHKKVTSFIGITCDDDSGNKELISDLNKVNVKAMTHKFLSGSSFYSFASTHYWKLGIFIDTRCQIMDHVASIFNEATEHRMFDELRSWLILGNDLTSILNIVNDKAFGASTDFVIAVPTDIERYYFYDIYNIFKERGGELNVTFYGNWQYGKGLTVVLTQPKFQRRANFHGLKLTAMFYKSLYKSFEVPLKQYFENYEDSTFKDWHSVMSYVILKHLSEKYNFTLVVLDADWVTGEKWGPVVGAVANYKVDFTGTAVSMTIARIEVLKFVHQNWDWHFRSCFIFRNPQPKIPKANQIIKPLAREVWYLLVGFITASVIVLSITQYYNYENSDNEMFLNSFITVLGSMCQRPTETKMTSFSTRIAFLFVMIFSLLMYNYYSASVVSVRLEEPIFKINNSLNELGKLHLKLASEYTAFFKFYVKKPGWDSMMFYEKYWKQIPESEQFKTAEVGMQLVQEGGFAYQISVEQAYYFIQKFFNRREVCELMEVDFAVPVMPTFGVTLNNTFIEIARVGLMKIAESGLRKRRITILQNIKPRCSTDISATSVTIEEFAPQLFVLLVGVLLALLAFVLEIIISKEWISFRHTFSPFEMIVTV